jgi:putative oxidoreductase
MNRVSSLFYSFVVNFIDFSMSYKPKSFLVEVMSLLLIMLFFYVSASKYFDFLVFKHDMSIQPFPAWLVKTLVYGLPPLEIIIALLLIFDKTRILGLYSSLILMSLFAIYAALIIFNSFDKIPCSCGGVIRKLTWSQHLFFNLFFVLVSLSAIILTKKEDRKITVIFKKHGWRWIINSV